MFNLNNLNDLEKKVVMALSIIVIILVIIFFYLRLGIGKEKNDTGQGGLTRPTSTEELVDSGLQIITTDENPEVGNIFGITIKENGSKPSGEVTVLLNGKPVGTCGEDEENCNIILGPFDETGAGNYDYEVQVKDGDGNTSKSSGSFTVVDKKAGDSSTGTGQPTSGSQSQPASQSDDSSPDDSFQITQVLTSGNQVVVGNNFVATAYTNKPVNKIEFYIDNIKLQECNNINQCQVPVGPMEANKIGQHQYTFTAINGTHTTSISGFFSVIAKTEENIVPATISSSHNKSIFAVGEELVITINVNPGSKELKESWVSIEVSTEPNQPGGGGTNSCGKQAVCTYKLPMTIDTDKKYFTYSGTAVFSDGSKLEIADKTFQAIIKAPTPPADQGGNDGSEISPIVSATHNKSTFLLGETLSIFGAVDEGSKQIKTLSVAIALTQQAGWPGAATGIQVCNSQLVCEYSAPVTAEAGGWYVNYKAIAEFTDGTVMESTPQTFQVTIAEQQVAPQLSISANPETAEYNQTVTFTAQLNPGSKTLDHTEIIVNNVTVKTCTTNQCIFTGGPYTNYAGSGISYTAKSYFKDGTVLNQSSKTVLINQIPETSISISLTDNSISTSELSQIIATVVPGAKVVDYIWIRDGSTPIKTCSGVQTCSTNVGPFPGQGDSTKTYSSVVFFTNNTSMTSASKNLYIEPDEMINPVINASYSPVQRNPYLPSQDITLSATYNSGDYTLELIQFRLGSKYVYFCGANQKSCSFTTNLVDHLGYTPEQSTSLNFSVEGIFSPGSKKVISTIYPLNFYGLAP